MIYYFLADIIVLIHFLFILFIILGGILAIKWKFCVWLHIPAFIWGVLIEFADWTCPLTPLENWFREKGGGIAYQTGFIDHYIIPIIYPAELTRNMQLVFGILLICINLGIYGWFFLYRKTK